MRTLLGLTNTMRRLVAVAVILGFVSGCGGGGEGLAAVDGTVTLDGQPLENGSITFFPAAGTTGPTSGANISGGKYSIPASKGAAVGTNKIEIHSSRKTGRKIPETLMADPSVPTGAMVDEVAEAVHDRYNSNSTLERKLESGKNTQNFELTSK